MDVLALLRSKNQFLSEFLRISEEFLAQACAGDFNQLDPFQKKRSDLLRGIITADREISICLEASKELPALKQAAQGELAEWRRLLQRISEVDHLIVRQIQAEQENLQKSLQEAKNASSIVSKFKSAWITESGDSLDKTL